MSQLKQTKYMDAMSFLGYITGAFLIILYVIFPKMWYLAIAAVVIIFLFRFIGYRMDINEQNKKYSNKKRK